jgi:general secretion pathway protein M
MTMDRRADRQLASRSVLGTLAYVAVVLALLFVAWIAASDLLDRRRAVAEQELLLAQLDHGRSTVAAPAGVPSEVPQGSPFLEGQTVTLAGAALLQRVGGAVTAAGGNVLSSQVDVQDAATKSGAVSLVASIEVAQADLQKLLYDLEAGMPYLFIDQLNVQVPDTVTRGEGGKLRVVLGVSGQWRGTK